MRRSLSLLVLLAALTVSGPASAQNKAAADSAFTEGRRLLARGDTEAACARFEESLELMEQLGVRLNLANCYEQLGRLSAAHAQFRTAQLAARRAGDRRIKFIAERLAALQKRMPTITIKLAAGARIPGLAVERDGQPVHPGLLDAALPVDPGLHTVVAKAPGRRPWSTRIEAREGTRSMVEVPVLQTTPAEEPRRETGPTMTGDASAATRATDPDATAAESVAADVAIESTPAPTGRVQRIAGLVTASAGLAAIAVGVKFGLDAGKAERDIEEQWNPVRFEEGETANRNMKIFTGVGAAALVGGGILYLLGRRGDPASVEEAVTLSPSAGPGFIGVAVRGVVSL